MTIRYCDFCGDTIPEGEGDPVTLADETAIPDARKDGCSVCIGILWSFTQNKNLRTFGDWIKTANERPDGPDPQLASIQPKIQEILL